MNNLIKILIFIFLLIFINIEFIFSQIAVLPFENLSRDLNGIDFEISEKVAEKLEEFGFETITPFEVSDFLSENHIPITGWIDKITSKSLCLTFRCNLILLGTITEFNKDIPAIAVTIRLLSVADYSLVWSKTVTISKSEEISFLNLKKKSWEDIEDNLINKLLAGIPEDVWRKGITKPEVDVSSVYIYPKNLTKDKYIHCKITLKASIKFPDRVKLLVNNKEVKEAKYDNKTLTCQWKAPQKEGRYNVILDFFWDAPYNFKKRIFITSFYVDNSPPKIDIKLRKVFFLKNRYYFNKYVKIVPIIKNGDAISHFKLDILSEKDNKSIISIERYNKLPKFFIWKGVTQRGGIISNGSYLLKLIVWDKAGNRNEITKRVYAVKYIPSIKVRGKYDGQKLKLSLEFSEKQLLPIIFWRIDIFDISGNLFASKEGENLPKFLYFSKKVFSKEMYFTFEAKDITGNRILIKKRKIVIADIKVKKINKKKIWVDEF